MSKDEYTDRCFLDRHELASRAHWKRVKECKALVADIVPECCDCGRPIWVDWNHLEQVHGLANARDYVRWNVYLERFEDTFGNEVTSPTRRSR